MSTYLCFMDMFLSYGYTAHFGFACLSLFFGGTGPVKIRCLISQTCQCVFGEVRDLTFIIRGGGGDRVEIFKKSIFFRRPSTLEEDFFIDPPQRVRTNSQTPSQVQSHMIFFSQTIGIDSLFLNVFNYLDLQQWVFKGPINQSYCKRNVMILFSTGANWLLITCISNQSDTGRLKDNQILVQVNKNSNYFPGTVMVEPEAVQEKKPRFSGPEFNTRNIPSCKFIVSDITSADLYLGSSRIVYIFHL